MSEIEVIPLVAINVMRTTLHGIDNKKLVNEIESSREDVDKKFWEDQHHTYYEDKRYPYGMPEAEKLLIELSAKVNQMVGKKLVLSEAWTLTLKEGQSVAAHSHKSNQAIHQEEYYSIAYYPSAPENSADLIFLATACNTIETSVVLQPKEGDLVVFNSYLMHMTNRHRNKTQDRIVISANFVPEQPNVKPNQDWSAYSRKPEQGQEKPLAHRYQIVAKTIFGDEQFELFLYQDGTAMAANHSAQMTVPSWSLLGGVLECDFEASVPMTTHVHLRAVEDGYGNIEGKIQIGEFAVFDIDGRKISS